MAHPAFKETYFRNMIKEARGGARLSYAFGFDKKGDGHCFVLDNSLDPAQLFAKVKSEKGLGQGSYGTCTGGGSALLLTPDKKLAGLRKLLSGLAKAGGWPVKQFKVAGEADEDEGGGSESEESPVPHAPPPAPGRTDPEEEEIPAAAPPEESAEQESGETPPPAPPPPSGGGLTREQMIRKADTISKAAQAWNKSTELATKELRKLQTAILGLQDPRSAPVIKGLEGILRRLDRIDDEAEEAAAAARAGDAEAFARESADLRAKVKAIADQVAADEMIRDADENPIVKVNIGSVLGNALRAILKSLN